MRQEKLSGYLLHQRPYREKRAIYQLYTLSHGVVHGVGARGMPLFAPLSLLATGKTSLKSFSQMTLGFDTALSDLLKANGVSVSDSLQPIKGRAQYALLYMNELLYKLLPAENPSPQLWQAYHEHLEQLYLLDAEVSAGGLDAYQAFERMKVYLRIFEVALFIELGVLPDFEVDSMGAPVAADAVYRFIPEMGFIPDGQLKAMLEHGEMDNSLRVPAHSYRGADLLNMAQLTKNATLAHIVDLLPVFNQLNRQLVDHLLDYRPLNSRTLWRQSLRYH